MTRRYVLTGAPGCGKTTTLDALRRRGYAVETEAATDVIAAHQALGVVAPWERPDFVDRVVDLQRERRLIGSTAEVQFLNRSPLCSLALARYLRLPVSQATLEEVALETVIRRADVSRSAVYRVWPTKEEFNLELLETLAAPAGWALRPWTKRHFDWPEKSYCRVPSGWVVPKAGERPSSRRCASRPGRTSTRS